MTDFETDPAKPNFIVLYRNEGKFDAPTFCAVYGPYFKSQANEVVKQLCDQLNEWWKACGAFDLEGGKFEARIAGDGAAYLEMDNDELDIANEIFADVRQLEAFA